MRTEFNINIKADVHEDDPVTRAAFQTVLQQIGEEMFAQVAIMSKRAPIIVVTVTDEEYGRTVVPLFTGIDEHSESTGE